VSTYAAVGKLGQEKEFLGDQFLFIQLLLGLL